MKKSLLLLSAFISLTSSAYSSLTITFNFSDSISQENQDIFTSAKNFWESQITGLRNGESQVLTINASTFDEGASGGSIRLGSAGPTTGRISSGSEGSFLVATEGDAEFNTNAAAVGSAGLLNAATVRHEVGHILGIGTLWVQNGLYETGSGEYTGANALRAYQGEFDPDALFVPIELDGGPGTANGHWNEVNDGSNPTVRFGPNAGESLNDTLLSGTLSGSAFLSDTSLGSLQDLGFTTVAFNSVAPIAVPEPSTFLFAFTGFGVFFLRRNRHR